MMHRIPNECRQVENLIPCTSFGVVMDDETIIDHYAISERDMTMTANVTWRMPLDLTR